ncbi:MAG TPA: FtsQ-type POTRA domain-containing protein [Candidatus Hydrogenedens sp.]|nr:FtsQ-type POTRA domain-containing protein [Candidatus Hydrogenedens sp.]
MAKMQLVSPPVQGRHYRKNKNKNKIVFIFKAILRAGLLSVVIIILLFITLLILIIINSPGYKIREVRIEGLKYFSIRDMEESINILKENGILTITDEKIRDTLLKIPFIEDCSINKDYKQKLITIYVKELVPYATLLVEDKLFLISHTGKILKQIHNVKESVGPLITGLKQKHTIEPGTYLDDEGLWSAMEFWYEYNQVPKNRTINLSEIVIDTSENLMVFFDEVPCETRWKRENLKRQLQNFALALNKVDLTRFPCKEYIDLRFNDDIIYK